MAGWSLTVPRTWCLHAKGVGRVAGCGPYRSRADAFAAIADRRRNGAAFAGERPRQVRLELRWDSIRSQVIAIDPEAR